jgi:D-glycero-alpha-D-manno-heptose 1-phosphate guanylyltransferase
MFTNEAIILAGGMGTRLKGVVDDVPKVMAPVNGRPFLEYVLDYLSGYVMEHVVLSVGYKKEAIMEHFGSAYNDIRISYAIEEEPLGTGGAIKYAFDQIEGRKAFVFNGDTLFRLNLIRHFDFHQIRQAEVTIVLRDVDDVSRYGRVELDNDKKVTGFIEKGNAQGRGLINGGVYLINKRFLNKHPFPSTFSFEKECLEPLAGKEKIYGLVCKQYFIDIGIPEDYQKAQHEFKEFGY